MKVSKFSDTMFSVMKCKKLIELHQRMYSVHGPGFYYHVKCLYSNSWNWPGPCFFDLLSSCCVGLTHRHSTLHQAPNSEYRLLYCTVQYRFFISIARSIALITRLFCQYCTILVYRTHTHTTKSASLFTLHCR